jgi:hypothetical protein
MIADRTADLSEKHAHGLGGSHRQSESFSTGFLRPLAISDPGHSHPEASQGGVRESEVVEHAPARALRPSRTPHRRTSILIPSWSIDIQRQGCSIFPSMRITPSSSCRDSMGRGRTPTHSPFLRFDLNCVYAGPSATTCVSPASFHAQTHIGKREYKRWCRAIWQGTVEVWGSGGVGHRVPRWR